MHPPITRRPGGPGEDDVAQPDVNELLQRPRYYNGTQMPVAGWFHPCKWAAGVWGGGLVPAVWAGLALLCRSYSCCKGS